MLVFSPLPLSSPAKCFFSQWVEFVSSLSDRFTTEFLLVGGNWPKPLTKVVSFNRSNPSHEG